MQQTEKLIDLHSHTDESDGTFSPEELIRAAREADLAALAITDHDTFAGYEKALPIARELNFDLVRGIELNSRLDVAGEPTRWAHILGFFPFGEPTDFFQRWLSTQRDDRKDRNERLAVALVRQGIDITLEEVEAVGQELNRSAAFREGTRREGLCAKSRRCFSAVHRRRCAGFRRASESHD